jgi:transcriptional regulator with XRE-family HTH domain
MSREKDNMYATTYPHYAIIHTEMETFSTWLLQLMKERGWNQAELARKSGLSRSIISDVLAEKVSPGFEFCIGIGAAFHIPAEQVMRIARLLVPAPPKTEQSEQLFYMFNQLNDKDRQTILDMMNFFLTK